MVSIPEDVRMNIISAVFNDLENNVPAYRLKELVKIYFDYTFNKKNYYRDLLLFLTYRHLKSTTLQSFKDVEWNKVSPDLRVDILKAINKILDLNKLTFETDANNTYDNFLKDLTDIIKRIKDKGYTEKEDLNQIIQRELLKKVSQYDVNADIRTIRKEMDELLELFKNIDSLFESAIKETQDKKEEEKKEEQPQNQIQDEQEQEPPKKEQQTPPTSPSPSDAQQEEKAPPTKQPSEAETSEPNKPGKTSSKTIKSSVAGNKKLIYENVTNNPDLWFSDVRYLFEEFMQNFPWKKQVINYYIYDDDGNRIGTVQIFRDKYRNRNYIFISEIPQNVDFKKFINSVSDVIKKYGSIGITDISQKTISIYIDEKFSPVGDTGILVFLNSNVHDVNVGKELSEKLGENIEFYMVEPSEEEEKPKEKKPEEDLPKLSIEETQEQEQKEKQEQEKPPVVIIEESEEEPEFTRTEPLSETVPPEEQPEEQKEPVPETIEQPPVIEPTAPPTTQPKIVSIRELTDKNNKYIFFEQRDAYSDNKDFEIEIQPYNHATAAIPSKTSSNNAIYNKSLSYVLNQQSGTILDVIVSENEKKEAVISIHLGNEVFTFTLKGLFYEDVNLLSVDKLVVSESEFSISVTFTAFSDGKSYVLNLSRSYKNVSFNDEKHLLTANLVPVLGDAETSDLYFEFSDSERLEDPEILKTFGFSDNTDNLPLNPILSAWMYVNYASRLYLSSKNPDEELEKIAEQLTAFLSQYVAEKADVQKMVSLMIDSIRSNNRMSGVSVLILPANSISTISGLQEHHIKKGKRDIAYSSPYHHSRNISAFVNGLINYREDKNKRNLSNKTYHSLGINFIYYLYPESQLYQSSLNPDGSLNVDTLLKNYKESMLSLVLSFLHFRLNQIRDKYNIEIDPAFIAELENDINNIIENSISYSEKLDPNVGNYVGSITFNYSPSLKSLDNKILSYVDTMFEKKGQAEPSDISDIKPYEQEEKEEKREQKESVVEKVTSLLEAANKKFKEEYDSTRKMIIENMQLDPDVVMFKGIFGKPEEALNTYSKIKHFLETFKDVEFIRIAIDLFDGIDNLASEIMLQASRQSLLQYGFWEAIKQWTENVNETLSLNPDLFLKIVSEAYLSNEDLEKYKDVLKNINVFIDGMSYEDYSKMKETLKMLYPDVKIKTLNRIVEKMIEEQYSSEDFDELFLFLQTNIISLKSFSKEVSKKFKEVYKSRTEEEIQKQIENTYNSIKDIIDKKVKENPSYSSVANKFFKATIKWLMNNSIRIEEGFPDGPELERAFELIARNRNIDPLQYKSHVELLDAFIDKMFLMEKIDLDKEPTLRFIKEIPGTDFKMYALQETKEGMFFLRKAVDIAYGKNANPWCIIARKEGDYEFEEYMMALEHYYNYGPKIVIFDSKGAPVYVGTIEKFVKKVGDIEKELEKNNYFYYNENEEYIWWDRNDMSHDGVLLKRQSEKVEGATEMITINPFDEKSSPKIKEIFKGNYDVIYDRAFGEIITYDKNSYEPVYKKIRKKAELKDLSEEYRERFSKVINSLDKDEIEFLYEDVTKYKEPIDTVMSDKIYREKFIYVLNKTNDEEGPYKAIYMEKYDEHGELVSLIVEAENFNYHVRRDSLLGNVDKTLVILDNYTDHEYDKIGISYSSYKEKDTLTSLNFKINNLKFKYLEYSIEKEIEEEGYSINKSVNVLINHKNNDYRVVFNFDDNYNFKSFTVYNLFKGRFGFYNSYNIEMDITEEEKELMQKASKILNNITLKNDSNPSKLYELFSKESSATNQDVEELEKILGKFEDSFKKRIPKKEEGLPFQKTDEQILGAYHKNAKTIFIDFVNQRRDTLPHEYAHHYILMFKDSEIVKEAHRKWSEGYDNLPDKEKEYWEKLGASIGMTGREAYGHEQLVDAIGKQAVEQKGKAFEWWKKFVSWIKSLFDLTRLDKEHLAKILTDAFLTKVNLYEFEKQMLSKQQAQQKVKEKEEVERKEEEKPIPAPVTLGTASADKYEKARNILMKLGKIVHSGATENFFETFLDNLYTLSKETDAEKGVGIFTEYILLNTQEGINYVSKLLEEINASEEEKKKIQEKVITIKEKGLGHIVIPYINKVIVLVDESIEKAINSKQKEEFDRAIKEYNEKFEKNGFYFTSKVKKTKVGVTEDDHLAAAIALLAKLTWDVINANEKLKNYFAISYYQDIRYAGLSKEQRDKITLEHYFVSSFLKYLAWMSREKTDKSDVFYEVFHKQKRKLFNRKYSSSSDEAYGSALSIILSTFSKAFSKISSEYAFKTSKTKEQKTMNVRSISLMFNRFFTKVIYNKYFDGTSVSLGRFKGLDDEEIFSVDYMLKEGDYYVKSNNMLILMVDENGEILDKDTAEKVKEGNKDYSFIVNLHEKNLEKIAIERLKNMEDKKELYKVYYENVSSSNAADSNKLGVIVYTVDTSANKVINKIAYIPKRNQQNLVEFKFIKDSKTEKETAKKTAENKVFEEKVAPVNKEQRTDYPNVVVAKNATVDILKSPTLVEPTTPEKKEDKTPHDTNKVLELLKSKNIESKEQQKNLLSMLVIFEINDKIQLKKEFADEKHIEILRDANKIFDDMKDSIAFNLNKNVKKKMFNFIADNSLEDKFFDFITLFNENAMNHLGEIDENSITEILETTKQQLENNCV